MFSIFVYFISIIFCLCMISFAQKCYAFNVINSKKHLLDNRIAVVIALLAASLPLIVLGGFRAGSVGTDTIGIYYPYYYFPYSVWDYDLPQTEFGFVILIKIARMFFGVDFTWMLVIISVFTTMMSMIGILKSSIRCKVLYVALIYLCFLYFDSFNIMRQMCAVSIIFASLHWLDEKKPFLFLAAVVFATSFHNSAIVCLIILLFYFFRENKIVRELLPIAIITTPIFLVEILNVLAMIPFFEKYVRLYSNINFGFSLANFALIIYNLPAYILIFMNRKKLITLKVNKDEGETLDVFNYVLIMMTLMAFTCNLFKLGMVWISRLSSYFAISQCILLPQCELFVKQRLIFRIVLVLYCVFYFVFFYFIQENANIFPYTFV